MGLFSSHRGLPGPRRFRLPIRLHSEFTVTDRLARGGRSLRGVAIAASNDARIVCAFLVIAAAALAYEMAVSFAQ